MKTMIGESHNVSVRHLWSRASLPHPCADSSQWPPPPNYVCKYLINCREFLQTSDVTLHVHVIFFNTWSDMKRICDVLCPVTQVLVSRTGGPNNHCSILAIQEWGLDIHPRQPWNPFIWLGTLKPLPMANIGTVCHSVTSSPAQQKYPVLATWVFPAAGEFGTKHDLI